MIHTTCKRCGRDRRARHLVRDRAGRWVCRECDPVPAVAPQGTVERRCRRCRVCLPLTPAFWHRHSGLRWRPECRACRSERRHDLATGASRVTPWHGPRVVIATARNVHYTRA